MEKISLDQPQKKLRLDKKIWNKAHKELSMKMRALSKAINGRGDLTFNLAPTDIKEPLPSELGPFISELVNSFQQLAESASFIEHEQATYSAEVQQEMAEHRPKLAKLASSAQIEIAGNKLNTLIASSPEEQEKGLMFREWPPPIMSFIYSSPRVNRFWMKQTPSPLDIVFSLKGKVTSIHKGEPYSTKLIGDYSESDLVVELPFGTCAKLGVQIGDSIILKK